MAFLRKMGWHSGPHVCVGPTAAALRQGLIAARPEEGARPAPGGPNPTSLPNQAPCSRTRFCSCSWPISSAMVRLLRLAPLAFSTPTEGGRRWDQEGLISAPAPCKSQPLLEANTVAMLRHSLLVRAACQAEPGNPKPAHRAPCTPHRTHPACAGTGVARSAGAGG